MYFVHQDYRLALCIIMQFISFLLKLVEKDIELNSRSIFRSSFMPKTEK
ncbi:hypothetical protein AEQU_0083 [Adlercreutzia equolifaciens DSM 19450]|nr:hypothetical protein AEQU_0083 [Adlercreutzia equolifaciens DSM 19450]